MADLKPKRGFVNRAALSLPTAMPIAVWLRVEPAVDDVAVLVIADPDRDPTESEVEALADALGCATRPSVARAAWELGARVQA